MVAVFATRTMTACVKERTRTDRIVVTMIRCEICDAWYEESEIDEELASPTCKSCGAV
jgi:hypothetical protein